MKVSLDTILQFIRYCRRIDTPSNYYKKVSYKYDVHYKLCIMGFITRFQVKKLFGHKNYDLKLQENTIILVGENGSGKSTILRLIYYFLAGEWHEIAKFEFEKLIITVNEKEFTLQSDLLKKIMKTDEMLERTDKNYISNNMRRHISSHQNELSSMYSLNLLNHIGKTDFELREEKSKEEDDANDFRKIKDLFNITRNELNTKILYLPTYRRIERELDSIFEGVDEHYMQRGHRINRSLKKESSHIELVEFGMNDVKIAISWTLDNIKDFSRETLNNLTIGYLSDVVDQKYDNIDVGQIKNVSDETIISVLDRIDDKVLTSDNKKRISEKIHQVKQTENLDPHAKVICHYFNKLLYFQTELQEKESSIRNFCKVCNQYLVDKEFVYDATKFQLQILIKDENKEIKLQNLSSGEKQIVSLFSHLYLSKNDNFFVLIDEPELSLSVPWQQRFLVDIKKGDFCAGLIAVTHSPFIYDNELKEFAHGLGEFLI